MARKRGIYREGYFKVSRRVLDSSLWCESGDVVKVFMTLLALSQDPGGPRDGTVYIAQKQLAAKCLMSEEALDACLGVLANPDPQSRTQLEHGRRIEHLPNGYRIVNYEMYHDRDKDEATSRARKNAGRLGGIKTAEVRAAQQEQGQQSASKSQQRRGRGRGRQDGEGKGDGEQQQLLSAVADHVLVFDYWKRVMGRSRAVLDEKRARAIKDRLKQYSVETLCLAIDGCRISPFHRGANDRGKIYDDIELICRDAKHVEQFLEAAREHGAEGSATEETPRQRAEREAREERERQAVS